MDLIVPPPDGQELNGGATTMTLPARKDTRLNRTLDRAVRWSGSEAALPPPRPLRTGRASFPASGSSLC